MTRVLTREQWRESAATHAARARVWTDPHLARRSSGQAHPVEDFLWEYYDLSPGGLQRWHPGLDVVLLDAAEYAGLSGYIATPRGVWVDPARLRRRAKGLRWTRDLLARTTEAAPRWGCFGLHEWAMVHGSAAPRHPQLALRLGSEGTDEVVRSHRISCTHVDAFRFFTPAARPLNEFALTRQRQLEHEQPACLHVSMDLYKVAYRLLPFVESSMVLEAFELALDVRRVDMQASPYNVTDFGLEPIAIETPEGKAEYVRRQREFTSRAEPLRSTLLDRVDRLLARAGAA